MLVGNGLVPAGQTLGLCARRVFSQGLMQAWRQEASCGAYALHDAPTKCGRQPTAVTGGMVQEPSMIEGFASLGQ